MPDSKQKGCKFERELVDIINEQPGFSAKRAWGSNGQSLGEDSDVDIIIESEESYWGKQPRWLVQAKRRKRVASYIKPPESCDVTILRGDRDKPYVVVSLERFLDLIR